MWTGLVQIWPALRASWLRYGKAKYIATRQLHNVVGGLLGQSHTQPTNIQYFCCLSVPVLYYTSVWVCARVANTYTLLKYTRYTLLIIGNGSHGTLRTTLPPLHVYRNNNNNKQQKNYFNNTTTTDTRRQVHCWHVIIVRIFRKNKLKKVLQWLKHSEIKVIIICVRFEINLKKKSNCVDS